MGTAAVAATVMGPTVSTGCSTPDELALRSTRSTLTTDLLLFFRGIEASLRSWPSVKMLFSPMAKTRPSLG